MYERYKKEDIFDDNDSYSSQYNKIATRKARLKEDRYTTQDVPYDDNDPYREFINDYGLQDKNNIIRYKSRFT